MARMYDHKRIEKKWQERWERDRVYRTRETGNKKCYVLDMFPYPSGEGLHVGHPKGYIATDIYSRYMRMKGFRVLHPMGWDAFGLPAENFAIAHKIHPRRAVRKNITRFKEQLSRIGFDYDWDREINTTDSDYYRWTQWIFLQLFRRGLAYESYEPINWCPSCKTGLANEDLEESSCERCGTRVERHPMRQWMLNIRAYADRLLRDLGELPWPEHVKEMQRNWIGRSEGTEISFSVTPGEERIDVFTTRPDTLYGATYMVLAPEHPLVEELLQHASNKDEIRDYVASVREVSEEERASAEREKTGVRLRGVSALHPASGEELPVFLADYILIHYGTGAIMAVPAHDERDCAFAKKYELPIRRVIRPPAVRDVPQAIEDIGPGMGTLAMGSLRIESECWVGDGTMVNSGEFSGMDSADARGKMIAWMEEKGFGKRSVQYKLRDWVFSRQRYWGEPIPIIHCKKCGAVPVPEKDLPVLLPDVKYYEPTGTGESPLAAVKEWVEAPCPACGEPARRETNTMPQWAGSSWYYLRYIDPRNRKELVAARKERRWMPVDIYVGGTEHATRHLIYARFWHKFLFDTGVASTSEPFMRLINQGLVLGPDGRKMSKRYGNIINPDSIVHQFGADTLRMYEMFIGPFEQTAMWSPQNMVGVRRFLERVYYAGTHLKKNSRTVQGVKNSLERMIVKTAADISNFSFNTAVSAYMIFMNTLEEHAYDISRKDFARFLKALAPFAPHIAEELWRHLGYEASIHRQPWPAHDERVLRGERKQVAVQVNGKTRGVIQLPRGATKEEVREAARQVPALKKYMDAAEIINIVHVPDRVINFVTK